MLHYLTCLVAETYIKRHSVMQVDYFEPSDIMYRRGKAILVGTARLGGGSQLSFVWMNWAKVDFAGQTLSPRACGATRCVYPDHGRKKQAVLKDSLRC